MATKWYETSKEPIGTYHMHGDNRFEVVRQNNFEFIITDKDKFNNLLKAGVSAETADDDDYLTDGQEAIRLSVDKTTVPNFTQAVLTLRRGNSENKMAGVPTFEAGSIDVIDYIGIGSKSILKAWQRLSYDVKTQKIGRMYDWTDSEGNLHYGYKVDCKLVEYTPDYEQIVNVYTLYGCWVSGISEPQHDHNNGEKKIVTATIQYDYAIPGEDE